MTNLLEAITLPGSGGGAVTELEGFLRWISHEQELVKRHLVAFEGQHPLGRLLDLDVCWNRWKAYPARSPAVRIIAPVLLPSRRPAIIFAHANTQ